MCLSILVLTLVLSLGKVVWSGVLGNVQMNVGVKDEISVLVTREETQTSKPKASYSIFYLSMSHIGRLPVKAVSHLTETLSKFDKTQRY